MLAWRAVNAGLSVIGLVESRLFGVYGAIKRAYETHDALFRGSRFSCVQPYECDISGGLSTLFLISSHRPLDILEPTRLYHY